MTPLLRKFLGMNWVLVLVMYGLLVFGVLAIESAARHVAILGMSPDDWGAAWAAKQKTWIIIGSLIYFVTALIDYRWLKWLGIPIYGVGVALLTYLTQQPDPVHQISLGPISFQPTQIVIAAGIMMIGLCLEILPKWHRFFAQPFVKLAIIGALCGVPFLLVVKNNDMGSAIVWLPISFVAILVGGIPFRHLLFLGLIGLGIVPIMYFLALPLVSERGTARVEQYLEILKTGEVDLHSTQHDNYAPYYVSMAVGKAGWKGAGWNAKEERGSIHAKRYIPYNTAHNDYIFAVIAEEQGFRGSLLLITAFSLLLIQCLFIAFYSCDFSGQLIASGVVALFFAHLFENIGMCILLMPITGIPLPLISYSGTFVVICMFLLGLVQSVWVHRKLERDSPSEPNVASGGMTR
jgi:rod shape determining protein RodA